MKLAVVILAAGQGKRMKSALPKVLQPLAGRPLLRHVVSRARLLEPDSIHVVYGHGGEQVRAAIDDADLHWALQAEQLGTGHALMQAMPGVVDDALVLVLYGDVPLINPDTLRQLIAGAGPKSLGLLTVMLDDPSRLWPHRAQCARRHPENRRAEGCHARAAQDPRGQQRHHRRPGQTTARAGSASCATPTRRASTT